MTARANPTVVTRLRNGLEVRNEVPGGTGLSHFVEHMQFKGTPQFPSGIMDRAISRDGGIWNAFTWLDWTAYFETMPSDRIDLALRLESDRMSKSVFDPKEVERERTAIVSEREGHENAPTFRLAEEIQAASFRVNGYHHEVIGDMHDIKTITRNDLYEHYRSYYVPSNAVLAVVGDFSVRPMLNRIRELFGDIPKTPRPEFQTRPEPPQTGERRIILEGPGETGYLKVAFRVPPAHDPDFMPLTMLGSVLAGAASLNFFAGGISNKTSRLYRALVEGEVAAGVRAGMAATIDPYLYVIHVTLLPDRTPEEGLSILDDELKRILDEPVEMEELTKALKQARALFAYGSESITNQGFWTGFSEMFADGAWFDSYLERLGAVRAEDVLEVARKYLLPAKRIVGMYKPTDGANRG
jgi:zinc protease